MSPRLAVSPSRRGLMSPTGGGANSGGWDQARTLALRKAKNRRVETEEGLEEVEAALVRVVGAAVVEGERSLGRRQLFDTLKAEKLLYDSGTSRNGFVEEDVVATLELLIQKARLRITSDVPATNQYATFAPCDPPPELAVGGQAEIQAVVLGALAASPRRRFHAFAIVRAVGCGAVSPPLVGVNEITVRIALRLLLKQNKVKYLGGSPGLEARGIVSQDLFSLSLSSADPPSEALSSLDPTQEAVLGYLETSPGRRAACKEVSNFLVRNAAVVLQARFVWMALRALQAAGRITNTVGWDISADSDDTPIKDGLIFELGDDVPIAPVVSEQPPKDGTLLDQQQTCFTSPAMRVMCPVS
jgi:hypothetical protein